MGGLDRYFQIVKCFRDEAADQGVGCVGNQLDTLHRSCGRTGSQSSRRSCFSLIICIGVLLNAQIPFFMERELGLGGVLGKAAALSKKQAFPVLQLRTVKCPSFSRLCHFSAICSSLLSKMLAILVLQEDVLRIFEGMIRHIFKSSSHALHSLQAFGKKEETRMQLTWCNCCVMVFALRSVRWDPEFQL